MRNAHVDFILCDTFGLGTGGATSNASGHEIAGVLITLRVDTLQLKEAKAMAANPVLAIEEQDRYTREEKDEPEEVLALRQRVKRALDKVFAGHEEYLGCTPD